MHNGMHFAKLFMNASSSPKFTSANANKFVFNCVSKHIFVLVGFEHNRLKMFMSCCGLLNGNELLICSGVVILFPISIISVDK